MKRDLEEGVVPTVPLAAMIPQEANSLLAAGRCVSSDQLANSALRVQASCMAMGQAAAAAATVAAKTGSSLHDVNVEKIKTLLRDHLAIVP